MTLPIQEILGLYHLLLPHESWTADYDADRVAVRAFGTVALAAELTSVMMSSHSLARDLVGGDNSMRRCGNPVPTRHRRRSRHCAQSTRDFRSLEDTHPTTPDRIRAAFLVGAADPGR